MSSRQGSKKNAPICKEKALLVFVKYPVPGEVKTRLIPELTPVQAAAFYKALVEDTLEVHKDIPGCETIVCFTPESARDGVRAWLGADIPLQSQQGDDLGSRQFDAIKRALEAGYRKAVIIGSDCPGVTPGDVENAFESLNGNRLVIGPSEDGGYYMIGASEALECVFEGISWGSGGVFKETIERAQEAGISVEILDVKYDIDTFRDLERYYRSAGNGAGVTLKKSSLRLLNSILGGKV